MTMPTPRTTLGFTLGHVLRSVTAGFLVLAGTATLSAQDSGAEQATEQATERPRRERSDGSEANQNSRHGGRFDGRRGGMADRLLGRGDGGEPRGRGLPRTISEEDFKRIIEIGKRISPEMATALEAQWTENREAAMKSLARNGRRLYGMLMLERRNPELFAAKVEELKAQFDLRKAAMAFGEARDAGDESAQLAARASIETLAAKTVDLGLKVRAMELAALDLAVLEMRAKLQEEVATSSARVEAMVERLLMPREERARPADEKSTEKEAPAATAG